MAREVGIIIKATDQASKTIKTVADTVEKAAKKSNAATEKTQKSAESWINKLAHLGQIAEKVGRQIERAFAVTVGASIESRAKIDDTRATWDRATESARDFGVALGDVVLPALSSVGREFTKLNKEASAFLRNNNKSIAKESLDWIVGLGKAITVVFEHTGIAITRVLTFAELGILSFGRTWHKAIAEAEKPLRGMLELIAKMSDLRGDTEGALKIRKLSEEWLNAEEKALTYSKAIDKIVEDQTQTEASITRVAGAITSAFDAAKKKGIEFGKTIRQVAFDAAVAADEWFADVEKHFEAKREKKFQDRMLAMTNEIGVRIRTWGGAFQFAADKGQLVADVLQSSQDKILENAGNGLPELFKAWQTYGDIVAENAGRPSIEIPQMLERLKEASKSVAEEISSTLVSAFESAFSDIGEIQTETRERMVKDAEGHWQKETQIISHHTKTVGDAFAQMYAGIGEMVLDAAAKYVIAKGIEMAIDKTVLGTKIAADAATVASTHATAAATIPAKAAEAAAGAAASQAGIPFIGPILAVAAAGAIIAFVMSKMDMFAHGGLVGSGGSRMISGGAAGRDDVLFRGMTGERVLSLTETHNYNRTIVRGGGEMTRGGSTGGGGNIYVNISRSVPTTRSDEDRWMKKSMTPALKRQKRLRQLAAT